MIYGQDVSNWQGAYHWPGGLKFGFAKATEGTSFVDGQFAHNWSALKSRGMVRGAYHFAHPANNAVTEAQHFLSVVRARGLHDGDLLALDLEDADGKPAAHVASWAKTWLTYVQHQTGIRPLLYTYRSFAATYCAGLGGYPLWIADPTTAGKPRLADPWQDWAIHQYSTAGGIDHDCTRLTVAQLRALGSTTTPEDDDMPEYVSVGMDKPQTLPPSTWRTIEWDVEYGDSDHNHWDKGGSSLVTGPARYSLTAYIKITGLPAGTWGQIRATRVATDDGSDRNPAPLQEFMASTGDTYVLYSLPVDSIGKDRKIRVEVIQWGEAEATVETGTAKALVWNA